jgi:hypothetical protein
MAHGREHQHQLLLVVAHVGRLVHDLDHQHRIGVGIEVGEGGEPGMELVAEDEAQVAHGRSAAAGRTVNRLARHCGSLPPAHNAS